MERVVKIFNDHASAESADIKFYQALTPEERMRIFFELIAQGRAGHHETTQGQPRVYRVIKRKQG